MSKNPQIEALNKVGQSVWYDNLSKDVLRSGALKELIAQGVSGLTSNPTIFKKAIADSADYDQEVAALSGKGSSPESICEELMVKDVAAAADLLKEVYTKSGGADGYASIEVSPFLARDTKNTVKAAETLWGKLARPNVMIKIPGTPQSLPAIRAVLEQGINVNVTLLFSEAQYEQVAEQYLAALETRAGKGLPIQNLSSVASFFVSRVDAICEKSFDEAEKSGKVKSSERESFFGLVGVANARIAYAKFEQLFQSARFKKLESSGARVQRPLWASTGTKNPKLNPLLYVEELAGPHTVNTMPPQTLATLLKGGSIADRLRSAVPEARRLIAGLPAKQIAFDSLMQDLQNQGVQLFEESYRELLSSIETKAAKISKGR